MNSLLDKLFRFFRFRKIRKYIPGDAVVCDLGCGRTAVFLKSISDIIKKGIGLDEEAVEYQDDKLEIKKYQISGSLPLTDESCDILTLVAVLEHLSNPQAVLRECCRVLKKGGKLILTTPSPLAKPILEFLAFKLKLIDAGEIRDHKNYFRPEDLRKLLVSSGFEENGIKISHFELFLNSLAVAQK